MTNIIRDFFTCGDAVVVLVVISTCISVAELAVLFLVFLSSFLISVNLSVYILREEQMLPSFIFRFGM